jgi:hypothetical protein
VGSCPQPEGARGSARATPAAASNTLSCLLEMRSLGFVKLDCRGKGITLTEGSRSAASKTAAHAEIKTPSPGFCGEGASHWISRVRRGDGGSADARVPNISPELRFGMRPAGQRFSSARFRLENARRSYRSSFSSSGKASIKAAARSASSTPPPTTPARVRTASNAPRTRCFRREPRLPKRVPGPNCANFRASTSISSNPPPSSPLL